MRKVIFCISFLVLLGCFTSHANAQGTFLYSQLSYDDVTGTVEGYSSTEIDYYSSWYYNAAVDGCLYDQSGQLLDSGSDQEPNLAEVWTFAFADPGTDYTLNSYYYEVDIYYYEDIQKSPEGCYPCDGCNSDCYYYYQNWYWYDPFGFSFYNPGYFSSWWYLYGYGPPVYIEDDEYNDIGSSTLTLLTHGNPDHLRILQDQTVQLTCDACCDALERRITYKVVDVNNKDAGTLQTLRESDTTVADSCNNQLASYMKNCFYPVPNPYRDDLSAHCPEFGDSDCGYDIPDEQWIWCSSNGLVPLAKLDYDVHHDRIVVSGHSGQLPLKWYVRADGSILPR